MVSTGDDLIFDDPSLFPKDLVVLDTAVFEGCVDLGNKSSTKKRKRQTKKCIQEDEDPINECKIKKIMHRDIERQRRQEMAGLYASLRSLLPLEYVKGRRSTSDHMHEAVNYIKHMEKNINELRNRRDKLKKASESVGSGNGSSDIVYNTPISITVSSCSDATVEILINCGLNTEEEGFPLSKVIGVLLDSGLSVFSSVTSKVNDRVLYRIQSQAGDLGYIDLPLLERRLVNMINISTKFWVIDDHNI